MAVVAEHISNGVRDLPPGRQHARVVAVREHAAAPPGDRVELLCHADRQPLHRTGERLDAVGLDDQVEMIALDRIMDDPDAESYAGLSQGALHSLGA